MPSYRFARRSFLLGIGGAFGLEILLRNMEAAAEGAGGPSRDQILLKNVPGLSRRNEAGTIIGRGSYNVICDKRVDSYETSTRCLSYSYEQQTINSARPGGTIVEHRPLLPEMSPVTA